MEDLTDARTTASIESIENAISQASAVSAAPVDMDVAQNDVGLQSEPEKISDALLPSSQSQSPFLPANDGQANVNHAPEIKTEAEISMVDPTGSQAQPLTDSTASSAPEKKKYASRPPRLGDSFQAIVPSLGSEVGVLIATLSNLQHAPGTRLRADSPFVFDLALPCPTSHCDMRFGSLWSNLLEPVTVST
jgi:hypothetical protein